VLSDPSSSYSNIYMHVIIIEFCLVCSMTHAE
jgi:hypothetical protein